MINGSSFFFCVEKGCFLLQCCTMYKADVYLGLVKKTSLLPYDAIATNTKQFFSLNKVLTRSLLTLALVLLLNSKSE